MTQRRGWSRWRYVIEDWPGAIIGFCRVYAFFLGLVFALDPLLRTVRHTPYTEWGVAGIVTFGLVYMGVALWATLWPEQGGDVVNAVVLAGVGLVTSIHPFNLVGTLFWVLVILTAVKEAVDRLRRPRDTR